MAWPLVDSTSPTIIIPGDIFDGQAIFLGNELAKKYHFQYDYVGDHFENDSLPAIGRHNDQTDSILCLINGRDWKQRFEKEYSESYSRDSILILFTKSKIVELLNDTTKYKFIVYRDSILSDDTFRVNVLGYHDNKMASYMRAIIKYPELKIISTDKTLIYRRRRN